MAINEEREVSYNIDDNKAHTQTRTTEVKQTESGQR